MGGGTGRRWIRRRVARRPHRAGSPRPEFRLLAALAATPNEVVRRRALAGAGWPEGAIVHENTLDAYIARLRRSSRHWRRARRSRRCAAWGVLR
jgi:DNA-binding response OmpR family regulator